MSQLAIKPEMHVLKLSDHSIFEQLQIEEALLRLDDRNWCIINEGTSPAIVMGISGDPEKLINHSAQKQKKVPVIRRFSGGGTVFVDKNTLFFTFICNVACLKVTCNPSHVFEWSEKIWKPALQEVDFQLRENDYVIGNKKFGGNAQYMRKDRWLHHSSFLWDFEESSMAYLRHPQKMPLYRNQRSHLDFLCKLKDFLPEKALLSNRLIANLTEAFQLINISYDKIAHFLAKEHRKSTSFLELE